MSSSYDVVVAIGRWPTGQQQVDVLPGRRPRPRRDQRRRAAQGANGGRAQAIPPAIREQATADYEAFIETHIRDGRAFSIEATLAREITFDQASRARRRGFRVHLTYVAAGVDECCTRVANRIDLGGHGVPASLLRNTYSASTRNLPRALREFGG